MARKWLNHQTSISRRTPLGVLSFLILQLEYFIKIMNFTLQLIPLSAILCQQRLASMKIKTTPSTTRHSGFSLFEMLTTLVIIGFFVLMALPSFGSTEPAKQSVHKQNAQNFCSLAFALSAAGVNITSGTNHVPTVLQRLVDGVTVTDGALAGREFKVPHLSEAHITGAAAYIKIKDGSLLYNGGLAP